MGNLSENATCLGEPLLHSHYGKIEKYTLSNGECALKKIYGFKNDGRGIDMKMDYATANSFAQLVHAFNSQSNAMGIPTPKLYSCEAIPRPDNSELYLIQTLQEYIPGVTLDQVWLNALEQKDTTRQMEVVNTLLNVVKQNYLYEPSGNDRHLFPYRPRNKRFFHEYLSQGDYQGSIDQLQSVQLPLTFDMKLNNFVKNEGTTYYIDLTPPCSLTPHGNSALMNLNPQSIIEDPGRIKGLLLGTSAHLVNIKVCAELAGSAKNRLSMQETIELFVNLLDYTQGFVDQNYGNEGISAELRNEVQAGFPYYKTAMRRNERVRFGPLMGVELSPQEIIAGEWV